MGTWISLISHHNLSSVDELLSVDVAQYDKGTRPPAPADQISTLLEQLHKTINEDCDRDAPNVKLSTLLNYRKISSSYSSTLTGFTTPPYANQESAVHMVFEFQTSPR